MKTATIESIIKKDNARMKELYPKGVNHKGTKLKHYTINGYKILAVNADQALNIHHQAKIDAE